MLALDSEQGSGKTTTATMLRQLVDPNRAPLRGKPRTEDDVIIAAENGRVVAFDNMSDMDAWFADALCRVATGAGLSKRKLFTDGEEHIAHVCRPVPLNGIPSLLSRGDLVDRALTNTLAPIADGARRPDSDVWAEFSAAAPGIFAVLLDALSLALRDAPTLSLPRLPRMADFARVACAAAPAFGWTAAEMLATMEGNREAANEVVLAADPIAEAVQKLAAGEGEWSGPATGLLAKLNALVPPETQRNKKWPKDGPRVSIRLLRLAPALRRSGGSARPSGARRSNNMCAHSPFAEWRKYRSRRSNVPDLYRSGLSGTVTRPATVPEAPLSFRESLRDGQDSISKCCNHLTEKGGTVGNGGNGSSTLERSTRSTNGGVRRAPRRSGRPSRHGGRRTLPDPGSPRCGRRAGPPAARRGAAARATLSTGHPS